VGDWVLMLSAQRRKVANVKRCIATSGYRYLQWISSVVIGRCGLGFNETDSKIAACAGDSDVVSAKLLRPRSPRAEIRIV